MMAQLNSSAAGQTVPHYHMHILPRHDGLELNSTPAQRKTWPC